MFQTPKAVTLRRRSHVAGTVAVALTAGVALLAAVETSVAATSTIAVNGATKYQTIEGFGASEGMGQASSLRDDASTTAQKQAMDLLYDRTTGAGLSILRTVLPSDTTHSILRADPGGPEAPPVYIWDRDNLGQVWFAVRARNYGLTTFYASADGAPEFMRTDSRGGALCGVPGTACPSGDWRQAYADYLVKYAKLYDQEEIPLTHLGLTSQPDASTDSEAMVMTPEQAADLVKVVGPTLRTSGLDLRLSCCEPHGWGNAGEYAAAINGDPAARSLVDVYAGHGYGVTPYYAMNTSGRPGWLTEWADDGTWTDAWDDGTPGSGFAWAQHLHTGLISAQLSAFLYRFGVSSTGTNDGLVRQEGSTITPSKRLWAFANHSRFVRPGAVRISSTTSDGNLRTSAFRNADGSVAVVVLNEATTSVPAALTIQNAGLRDAATVVPYVTDASRNTAAQTPLSAVGGSFDASVPARALVTYVIAASDGTPVVTTSSYKPTPTTAVCTVAYRLTSEWTGGFQASLTITNQRTTALLKWQLAFTFPADQLITQAWSANYTQKDASVVMSNAAENGRISPGGSVTVGFIGTWSQGNTLPSQFTLAGVPCAVV